NLATLSLGGVLVYVACCGVPWGDTTTSIVFPASIASYQDQLAHMAPGLHGSLSLIGLLEVELLVQQGFKPPGLEQWPKPLLKNAGHTDTAFQRQATHGHGHHGEP